MNDKSLKTIENYVLGRKEWTNWIVKGKGVEELREYLSSVKECPICYTSFENHSNIRLSIFFPCFHIFCKNCIDQWKDYDKSCPMCRCEGYVKHCSLKKFRKCVLYTCETLLKTISFIICIPLAIPLGAIFGVNWMFKFYFNEQ